MREDGREARDVVSCCRSAGCQSLEVGHRSTGQGAKLFMGQDAWLQPQASPTEHFCEAIQAEIGKCPSGTDKVSAELG